jgi:hypothetical protein
MFRAVNSAGQVTQRQVVHAASRRNKSVTISLIESVGCHRRKKLSFICNILQFRTKNRHINKPGAKQGKIRTAQIFSTELSTETVDRFTLELVPPTLQRHRESKR